MSVKYIFVTGGVTSGLGKGITAASLGRLLKERGYRVMLQKFDPYINEDPGNMSPYQHGEVFVTDDGASTDLDIGHYERFIDENLDRNSNISTGKIYWAVLNKERCGGFEGRTVQVIPHITDAIKDRLFRVGKAGNADMLITEIGGTVGDIESLPFLEAIRQVESDVGREHVMYIHVTLVPYLNKTGELKTKPTQHSVKELRSIGISPDVIVCRTEHPLSQDIKDKIGLFCNLSANSVIQNIDVEVAYEVPLMLENEGLADIVCKRLGLDCRQPDLVEWSRMVEKMKNLSNKTEVALVGKYTELRDAYLSVVESLNHGGIANDTDVSIRWINAESIEGEGAEKYLDGSDAIIVPGGFGERGIEGKIAAANYARKNNVPYLGLALGMQVAVIGFAREVLGYGDANSVEFDPKTIHPVVELPPEKMDAACFEIEMRCGLQPCKNKPGSKLHEIYNKEDLIFERHRHKYEINRSYLDELGKRGFVVSGTSPDGRFIEAMEIAEHPWFLCVMFQPEFRSRPTRPHPIFVDFVKAALAKL